MSDDGDSKNENRDGDNGSAAEGSTPAGPTMEEELLQQMIRDRESRIKASERKMEDQKLKLQRIVDALAALRDEQSKDNAQRTADMEKLKKDHEKAVQNYTQARESLDMTKQQQQQAAQQQAKDDKPVPAALHVYNDIMRTVAEPADRDSSYVLRMQAQLCKAMHSMGMVETQLAILQQQNETRTIKFLKDTMTSIIDEKSQAELKFMNDLVLTDQARQENEKKQMEIINGLIKEKETLEEEIEKKDEEEDESSVDSEEEEERQELLEILEQGREELERMENENKKAEATIISLQKRQQKQREASEAASEAAEEPVVPEPVVAAKDGEEPSETAGEASEDSKADDDATESNGGEK